MKKTPTRPAAPKGLEASTKRWFIDTCERWELEPHHLRLLAIAARAWDEAEQASALMRKDGLLITMPSGATRPHPAARMANEARAMFARALRELDLDLNPPAEAKRPSPLRSIAGGR